MAVFLKRASRRDCEAVIADIRPADEAELVASDGDARMALWTRVTFWFRGKNGHRKVDDFATNRWFTANRRARFFSFRVFPRVRARFPNMRNFVDARNSASIAWLSKLGFTMGAPVERGPYGLPFIPFWIGGGDECVIR